MNKIIWRFGVRSSNAQMQTKEDIDIEQQLYENVRGKNFALNCLSWKLTEMIMITNEVIPENLVLVR